MAKKNTLIHLNDHLFEQLERLNNDDLTGDRLREEISRSIAMTQIAKEIVASASVVAMARKTSLEFGVETNQTPRLLSE